MTITPTPLYLGGQLGTSAATLFTAQANAKTVITQVTFNNTDTVAHTISVYLVRSGGSASAANQVIGTPTAGHSLAAGENYSALELVRQILAPGDFIQAKADTGAVVTCPGISGYVVT